MKSESEKLLDELLNSYDPYAEDVIEFPDYGPGYIDYKYNESELLLELKDYIDSTYSEHYAEGNIEVTEFLIAKGHGEGHCLGNVIKYAARYGKKQGRNRKDIMKILHYALMMLYVHDLQEETDDFTIDLR